MGFREDTPRELALMLGSTPVAVTVELVLEFAVAMLYWRMID